MRDDSQGLSEFDPPFEVVEPARGRHPIVLNSPHSGAHYPAAFLAASRLDALTLRRSEDAFVDELFAPARRSARRCCARCFPRAFLDLNREPFELDPQMFDGRLPDFANTRSLRVAAGLGVIPRVVGDAQPIYREPMPVDAALRRIATLHRPYHARLGELLEAAQRRFGFALLIDCHSMPSTSPDVGGCDIVLGDRYGSSAARWIVDAVETRAARRGSRGAPQQALCRRLHHRALRPAGRRPPRPADRDQPQPLHGRARLAADRGRSALARGSVRHGRRAICAKAREAQGTRWAAE